MPYGAYWWILPASIGLMYAFSSFDIAQKKGFHYHNNLVIMMNLILYINNIIGRVH